MVNDISFGDLDDDLVQLVINQLPAILQVAVTRVCSRFEKVAFKSTKILDVKYIPYNKRIGIVKMMTKLKSVHGLSNRASGDNGNATEEFMKALAAVNPNITSFRGWARRGIDSLVTSFVKSVKNRDQSYTGSDLKYVFQEYGVYEQLIIEYPDLQLKCSLNLYSSDIGCGSNLHVTQLSFRSNPVGIAPLLSKTVNVTDLELTIDPDSESFRLNSILETISKLPLKILILLLAPMDIKSNQELDDQRNSLYSMVPDDYKSLQKVFNIPSLRIVDMRLKVGNVDRQAIYDSFVNSTNNYFRWITCVSGRQLFASNLDYRYENGRQIKERIQFVNIDSVPNFDISSFVNKFKKNCDRHFKIVCTDGRNFVHDCDNLPFNIEVNTRG